MKKLHKKILYTIIRLYKDLNEVGSETGIEQEELPLPADNFKSEFDWLASIKSIFKNLVDIIRLLIKWR